MVSACLAFTYSLQALLTPSSLVLLSTDPYLEVLQAGCFKYFQLGGEAVAGPISLLSALAPKPLLLFGHFFCVAFYSIWCMFMHPQPVAVQSGGASSLVFSCPSAYMSC